MSAKHSARLSDLLKTSRSDVAALSSSARVEYARGAMQRVSSLAEGMQCVGGIAANPSMSSLESEGTFYLIRDIAKIVGSLLDNADYALECVEREGRKCSR